MNKRNEIDHKKSREARPHFVGQESIVIRAESSIIRQSVRKMQLVTRAISGMTPAVAVEVLQFMDKKAAEPIKVEPSYRFAVPITPATVALVTETVTSLML